VFVPVKCHISLACPVVVLSCFACLVFRTIPKPFKATKTCGGLNVIKTLSMKTGWRKCTARVGWSHTKLRKKIQNGQHVNKGKMHRIIISLGPCGKLGSTKWGVQ